MSPRSGYSFGFWSSIGSSCGAPILAGARKILAILDTTRASAASQDSMCFTPPARGDDHTRTLIVQGDRGPFYPVKLLNRISAIGNGMRSIAAATALRLGTHIRVSPCTRLKLRIGFGPRLFRQPDGERTILRARTRPDSFP